MGEIRIGIVSRIDYEAGRVAVTYPDRDNSVTELLPYLSIGREYYMPRVGQYVAVAHLSTAEEKGVVLGPYWTPSDPSPETGKDRYHKELSNTNGDAFVDHEPRTGTLTICAADIVLQTENGSITVDEIIEAVQGGG